MQERKLKGELTEVTEKYGEVCQEKVTLEDEMILLRDGSVPKEDHNKVGGLVLCLISKHRSSSDLFIISMKPFSKACAPAFYT